MNKDFEYFVRSCLHGLATEALKVIPRPLSTALHAVERDKLLNFDFCYMSKGSDDFKYVSVLKDDHGGYVWFAPTNEATAEVLVES